MSDDGFTVDYKALNELGQQLANLRGEFNRGDDALKTLLDTLSDDDLKRKVKDFADNWSEKKYAITSQLDSAAGFAISAARVYRDTDEAIAKGYTKAGETLRAKARSSPPAATTTTTEAGKQ